MQKKITVTLNKIDFLDKVELSTLLDIFLNNPFNEERGVGFSKAEIFEDVLEASLIKRTPTSLLEFDIELGDFVQRNIYVFEEIHFCIDLQNKLIYSFTSAAKLNKVKASLKDFISTKTIYENIHLNPQRLMTSLSEKKFEFTINEIIIKNFVYKQGAKGKYTAQILKPQIGEELMGAYSEELYKVTIDVSSSSFDDFTLTVSTNNTINIKSTEEDSLLILNEIKKQIL